MEFKIGDIIKHKTQSALIVLASKEKELNTETLEQLNKQGTLKIVDINILAAKKIKVEQKDYIVGKILSFDEQGYAIIDFSSQLKEYFEYEITF